MSLSGRTDADDLVEEMLSLGSVVRREDGSLSDPPGTLVLG